MIIGFRNFIILSFVFFLFSGNAQTVSRVYKIDGLVNRINNPDTTYIINFWATWCKPCVAELPSFDSLSKISKVKILLVSLDFKEDIEKKVNPFLKSHNITMECVLLDEINGNDFIDKIDKSWTGAIPATLFKNKDHKVFIEKKMHLAGLQKQLAEIQKP